MLAERLSPTQITRTNGFSVTRVLAQTPVMIHSGIFKRISKAETQPNQVGIEICSTAHHTNSPGYLRNRQLLNGKK